MPRVWKEVLCRGRQRGRDGNWFGYGRRDIREADANVSKMLSRGVPIPAVWEHQDVEAGDPAAWKARYAKYTFGHVVGRRVNARGNLELLHEVPDPADVRQLRKVRFCSPKVYPLGYSDSRGGEYRGATIAHVAATPTPVQTWQRPWPAELSRADAVYLSYSPEGPTVAEETETTGGEGEGGGETAELNELIEALRAKGMMISDKVSNLRELIIAVESSGDADDEDADDEDDTDAPQTTGPTDAAGGGAPMLMSDARYKGYAKNEKRDLERRANALFASGRIDRPTHQKLVRQVGAQELSFTKAGDLVPTKLAYQIEAYEQLPKGSVWSPKGKRRGAAAELSTTEVPDPDELTGKNAGADAVVAEQERLAKKYSARPAK